MKYFITGASGVGKTTLTNKLEKKHDDSCRVFHFDSIGVPSNDEMKLKFGSGVEWQKAKTVEWIDRLLRADTTKKCVLEGQVNLEFIRDAFAARGVTDYKIILIDCDESKMGIRLTKRLQPELFTPEMKTWRQFLRQQATEFGVSVIDTSSTTENESLHQLELLLGL